MTYSMIFILAGLGFTLAGLLFTFVFDRPALDPDSRDFLAEWMSEQPVLMGMSTSEREECYAKMEWKKIFHIRLSRAGFWFLVFGTVLQIAGTVCR